MSQENKPKKKWYKRWWAIVLYFFIFIIIITPGSDDDKQASNQNQIVNDHLPVRTKVAQDTSQENVTQKQVAKVQTSPVTEPQPIKAKEQPTLEEPKETPAEKLPAPKLAEKSYQQVFTFSGNGAKKSEPFIINGSRFKIKYDCTGDLCQAFLRNLGSEYDLNIIMNSVEPISDETIIYGPGEYYIDSNSLGSYTMVVEDYL